MTFLETILAANREQPPDLRYRDGRRSVGDGVDVADVAFYGPTALRRPATTRAEGL